MTKNYKQLENLNYEDFEREVDKWKNNLIKLGGSESTIIHVIKQQKEDLIVESNFKSNVGMWLKKHAQ